MKQAKVYMYEHYAGLLTENDEGFEFQYDDAYLNAAHSEAISLTLPLKKEVFKSEILFPFFDGLIPEGWLLDIATKNWKLNERDRMSVLLVTCTDCIGAVSIEAINKKS